MARIRNVVLFDELDKYMSMVESCNLPVKLWRIPREMNLGADQLVGEKQR